MKKFDIKCSNARKSMNQNAYYVEITDGFSDQRNPYRFKIFFLTEDYGISQENIEEIILQYEGEIFLNSSVYFKTNKKCQEFIDNVLVPYEIAFNL